MKRKNIILTSIILGGLIAVSIPANIFISKAINENKNKDFSSAITPTTPGKGETVCFLPNSLLKFWEMDDLVHTYQNHSSEIGDLVSYSVEQSSWTNHNSDSIDDINYRREIFNKYDLFRPTNNLLAWNSSISAKEYKVIISQDKNFETIEREYVVDGNKDSVIFDNPYTGTDYYWQVIATQNDDKVVYSDIFSFTSAQLPRTLNIEGVSNTRDLGGNVGLNNKRTKQGLIYRGMALNAISDSGKTEFLENLGIKTELDLRNNGEGSDNFLNLSNYYRCPSPYLYLDNPSTADLKAQAINWYSDNSLVTSFGNAIKVLANKNNYPVYFHCAVGRDRTGWLGVVIDLLSGVSEEIALKEYLLSLFSTSGAYIKGNLDFYNRFIQFTTFLNTFSGDNMSEKVESYLVEKANVTHEDCENVRKIFLGEIDTGYVPGKVNPDPYTGLCKVTFRRYGATTIIKMVESGSKLEEPEISDSGVWYHGNDIWDFDNDVVTEDIYLDYLTFDKCKVAVHYSGINLPDGAFDVAYHTNLDFTMFNKEGYTFKVYDDRFYELTSCLVESDITLNVVYRSINGYVPKGNSRIIVTAGQSNAAGVGHYEYLENSLDEAKIQEINNGYGNVLLTGYSHGQYLDGFRKISADKHSVTTNPGTFGYELSFAERLSKAFPDENTYIVKFAFGGVSLNFEFISPSSDVEQYIAGGVPGHQDPSDRGWMYREMVQTCKDTIATIEQQTNTIPMIEAFLWMQGETDSTTEDLANVYLSSFNTMISDFTTELKDNISYKFAVYDAGINESIASWPYAQKINGMKKSRVDSRNIYIDTIGAGLTTMFEPIATHDEAHYDAACYIELGHLFADAYLSHINKNYTHNEIVVQGPEKVTLKISDGATKLNPTALFNGKAVDAKFSYFARDPKLFTINGDNELVPLLPGSSLVRITAYYQDEVDTIIVPVEIIQ